ncbi:MAG: hypothetical protein KDB14_31270 [Planctomycetales bacterium]|nr:hypothetical protein [Planctomycetales bacterium]
MSVSLAVALMAGFVPALASIVRAQEPTVAAGEADEKIAQLIRDLGHEDFAVRDRAQERLERLGLAAFDALNEAVEIDDIEVVLRARYLLRSMRVQWFSEDDPASLRQLLTDYGNQSDQDRETRIDSISKVDEGDPRRALCRLARYETNARLSKLAALRAMQLPRGNAPAAAAQIRRLMQDSRRPGARWLMLYADQLDGDVEGALQKWNDVIREERRVLVSAATRTSLGLVRDLSRWHVEQLESAGQLAEATEAIRRSLGLSDGSADQVKENAVWLMKKQAWSLVRELAERYPEHFDSRVDFKYLLAEAELGGGNQGAADEAAKAALALKPDAHEEHIEAAIQLSERGMHQWAAAEFEERIRLNEAGSLHNLRSRFLYSEMLHDGMLQQLKAAETLKPAIEVMEQEAIERQVRMNLARNPQYAKSRMHYFFALGYTEQKEYKKARENLELASQLYGDDPDVLIAMYRLPDQDEAWKDSVSQRITASAARTLAEIEQYRKLIGQRTVGPVRQQYERRLSTVDNQYAWLVANTEGDYRSALACSRESLKLTPGSPTYLDTLGRCYYAVGDFENAVKHQRLAVAQTPHSGLMRRQLEVFESALAKHAGGEPSN